MRPLAGSMLALLPTLTTAHLETPRVMVRMPPPSPDPDCRDVPYRRSKMLPPDPHYFDGDHDGIGCERVTIVGAAWLWGGGWRTDFQFSMDQGSD
jgi:hypothetical protein